jgi:uncharacterized protein (TIGR00730 family)
MWTHHYKGTIDRRIILKKLAVYCGSSNGAREEYIESAVDLGKKIVERGFGLVYGGGCNGIMNIIAGAVLSSGGEVIGVAPRMFVDAGRTRNDLSQFYIVDTMHQRKAKIVSMVDGFIALPGGIGTLEELLEIYTWSQLGLNTKPCGLLNVCGYYDPLLQMFDRSVKEGFLSKTSRALLQVEEQPGALLDRMFPVEL